MAEAAGPNTYGPGEWAERLGWTYGLIAPDNVERGAALVRLDEARAEAQKAHAQYNEYWIQASRSDAETLFRAPEVVAARARADEVESRCLPEALWLTRPADDIRTCPQLSFALLFLEWEARYPEEWTEHAKAWGTKQTLIRSVAVSGHSEVVTEKLIDIVELVVQRAYRCKDREYVRVARAVDGDELRTRLNWARHSHNPWSQLHAGYVLWLLDHPEIPNTFHVWRTWLADTRTS